MTFKEEKVNEFLQLFEESQDKIRHFEGCKGLILLRDVNNSSVFFTYSLWVNDLQLSKYRTSPLFEEIWPKTKVLFLVPAEAWSLKEFVCN